MADVINGAEGLALLRALGFEEDADGGCLAMLRQHSEDPTASAWIRVTGPNGGMPWDGSQGYRAVASYAAADSDYAVTDIAMDSADARDVMAFAIAVLNDLHANSGDHALIREEDAFVVEDTMIHNAFGEVSFDWQVDSAAGAEYLHLRSPVENYGADYIAWRDARAESLLSLTATGPSRQLEGC